MNHPSKLSKPSKLQSLPPIPPPPLKTCPYPPCRKQFTPIKSNQVCCCPKHTWNMQMMRHRERVRERVRVGGALKPDIGSLKPIEAG